MDDKEIAKVLREAERIYFEENLSAIESVEKAKEECKDVYES